MIKNYNSMFEKNKDLISTLRALSYYSKNKIGYIIDDFLPDNIKDEKSEFKKKEIEKKMDNFSGFNEEQIFEYMKGLLVEISKENELLVKKICLQFRENLKDRSIRDMDIPLLLDIGDKMFFSKIQIISCIFAVCENDDDVLFILNNVLPKNEMNFGDIILNIYGYKVLSNQLSLKGREYILNAIKNEYLRPDIFNAIFLIIQAYSITGKGKSKKFFVNIIKKIPNFFENVDKAQLDPVAVNCLKLMMEMNFE